jgi:hypothetical protein
MKAIKVILMGMSLILFFVGIGFNNSSPFLMVGSPVFAQASVGGDCQGGSCSFTEYFGGEIRWSCSACCGIGLSATCNTSGCRCE